MERHARVIAERWFKAYWSEVWDPADVEELASPKVVLSHSIYERKEGSAAVAAFGRQLHEAFPDISLRAIDTIVDVDSVVFNWKCGGTHTGPAFFGLRPGLLPVASGRKMHFDGISIVRVRDGQIVEDLGYADTLTVAQQLHLVPTQGTTSDNASLTTAQRRESRPTGWSENLRLNRAV